MIERFTAYCSACKHPVSATTQKHLQDGIAEHQRWHAHQQRQAATS